jgi:hypothetical protein
MGWRGAQVDREYTEFVNGVALVISVEQAKAGLWIAAADYLDQRRQVQAATAQRARAALVEALKREIPRPPDS